MPVKPVVAIVGRPNVGKSTLFNRLAGRKLAIVDDTPGVTRDRRESDVVLGDLSFTLVDTAGFEDTTEGQLASRIQEQTARAIAGADVTLLVIDARVGIVPLDQALAQILRRSETTTVLVANKCESRASDAGLNEAFSLGMGEPIPFSAEHGIGMGLLHEALQPLIAAENAPAGTPGGDADTNEAPAETSERPSALQLAIVGRPNVGKSTLINRLIGADRLVTGPEAGITRDAISIDWTWCGRPLRLFDTAGLRKRSKVAEPLEEMAGAETLRAIRFAQVVVVVIDAVSGLERQDLTIADMIENEGRAAVLAINKWDLVEDRSRRLADIRTRLEHSLPQVRGLRFVTLSGLSGEGLDALLPAVESAYTAWTRKVSTPQLNRFLRDSLERHPPPPVAGKPVRLRYITQANARPPTFILFANRPDNVPEAWLRYFINAMRERFRLQGVPVRVRLRKSRNPYDPA